MLADVPAVHGMRMPDRDQKALHATWYRALRAGLRQTAWGKAYPDRDLEGRQRLRRLPGRPLREAPRPRGVPKRTASRATTCSRVHWPRAPARHHPGARTPPRWWDEQGRPRGPVAHLVNRKPVHESARYMNNGPVTRPDPAAPEGAYFQVQERFKAAPTPRTRLVVGHSLGSVIAYEGLCSEPAPRRHLHHGGLAHRHPAAHRRAAARAPRAAAQSPGSHATAVAGSPALDELLRACRRVVGAGQTPAGLDLHPDIVDVEVVHRTATPPNFLETATSSRLVSHLKHAELCA